MQHDYNINIFKQQKIMTQKYSTKQVNRTFKLKVFGMVNGKKVNSLFGVSGLIAIIGLDFFNKFTERAMNCKDDKCVCKLRRGVVVTYYMY